jgi:hypothetical protein
MLTIDLSDKSASILRLAVHPSATEGEWQAAAIAFVRGVRKNCPAGLNTDQSGSSPTLGFGKYNGRTVKWVVENNPAYAEWFIAKMTDLSTKTLRKEFRREMKARYK